MDHLSWGYLFLGGCSANLSTQVEGTKDSNPSLTEFIEIEDTSFDVKGVSFRIDYPVELEIIEDEDLAFNL